MNSRPALPNLFAAELAVNPYPTYAALRDKPAVVHLPADACWVVHRYADAREVLRSKSFSSVNASFERTLLGADGAGHASVRGTLVRSFSPRAVEQRRLEATSIIRRALDTIATDGGGDLVTRLAEPLPSETVAMMIGIDAADISLFRRGTAAIMSGSDPSTTSRDRAAAKATIAQCRERLSQSLATFAADDRQQAFAAFDATRSNLTLERRIDLALLFWIAGTQTTSHLIGNAVRILLSSPAIEDGLRRAPESIPAFLEEVLRYTSPIQRTRRRALQNMTIGGCPIPAGGDILVLIGAANRDPTTFSDPDRFMPTRDPNEHLAFGAGVHLCLGIWLARMHAGLAISMLLERFAEIKLVREANDRRDLVTFAPTRLEVQVRPSNLASRGRMLSSDVLTADPTGRG